MKGVIGRGCQDLDGQVGSNLVTGWPFRHQPNGQVHGPAKRHFADCSLDWVMRALMSDELAMPGEAGDTFTSGQQAAGRRGEQGPRSRMWD